MKSFSEMLPQDREFEVNGVVFHWRDVRPEVLSAYQPSENGGPKPKNPDKPTEEELREQRVWDANAGWRAADEQILMFIEPAEHSAWTELRARDDNPVTIAQLVAIVQWLMEAQSNRPTETPSPSDTGRGRTAATSKAG